MTNLKRIYLIKINFIGKLFCNETILQCFSFT